MYINKLSTSILKAKGVVTASIRGVVGAESYTMAHITQYNIKYKYTLHNTNRCEHE